VAVRLSAQGRSKYLLMQVPAASLVDLDAIRRTATLIKSAGAQAFVIFNAAPHRLGNAGLASVPHFYGRNRRVLNGWGQRTEWPLIPNA
jgi:hypothetical protein